MSRTEISQLGEFALIDRLTEAFPLRHESSLKGVGDDAAVIATPDGMQTLLTTDLLLEGIHFDLTYTPLKHLGYKAAIGSFSDLYAMNAHPQQLLCSVGVSQRFAVEDLEELYAGLRLACERYGVDLVGGDTSASLTGLCLSITAVGVARPEEIVYRSGAKPTDLICVSGNLGAAYMGLQLLEREKRVFAGQEGEFDPDFAQHEYILERQLKPEARQDIILALRAEGLRPTAMIDDTDGLAVDADAAGFRASPSLQAEWCRGTCLRRSSAGRRRDSPHGRGAGDVYDDGRTERWRRLRARLYGASCRA